MRTSAIILILGLLASVSFGQAPTDGCLPAVSMSIDQDLKDIDRQCALNRRILTHCFADRNNNLMSQAFAQRILNTSREQECKRQEGIWIARNKSQDLTCAKAQQEYAQSMQQYQSGLMKHQETAQEYEQFWAERLPPGQPDPDFELRFCIGDCPADPGPAATMPSPPTCRPFTCEIEDESALRRRAELQARQVLERDFQTIFEAAAHDCQEKKLRASALQEERRIREEHERTITEREASLGGEVERWTAARDGRRSVRDVSKRNKNSADEISDRLGPLRVPVGVPTYPANANQFRPLRVRYGVATEFRGTDDHSRSADSAAFVDEQHSRRCREIAILQDRMLDVEDRIRESIERANSAGQDNRVVALEKQLRLLRSEHDSVLKESTDCEVE